jgi:hypothetical protein
MEASELPDRFEGLEQRIPESWEEFHGPASGVVHLPNRLAWSGPADFDLDDRRQRLTLFSILLDCGQRADIARYVDPDLLRGDWHSLCRATTSQVTRRWEQRLPGLAPA